MSIYIDGQEKVGGSVASAFKKNERKDDLFNQIVNQHLDPKRSEASTSSSRTDKPEDAGRKAGQTARSDSAQQDGKTSEDKAAETDAAPVEPEAKSKVEPEPEPAGPSVMIDGEAASASDVTLDLSGTEMEEGPETGIDAEGDAAALLAAGAQAREQQGSVGQMPPSRGEAKTDHMTSSQALRHMVGGTNKADVAAQAATETTADAGKLTAQVTDNAAGNQTRSRPTQMLAGQGAIQAQAQGQIAQGEMAATDPSLKPQTAATASLDGAAKTDGATDAAKAALNPNQAATNQNAAVVNPGVANDAAAAARQQAAQQAAQQQATSSQQAAAKAAATSGRGGEAPLPTQSGASTPTSQGADFSQMLQNQTQQAKAAAKPSQPLPAQHQTQNHALTDQVAVQINKAVKQGMDRINIQLKPAELGRIDVTLEVGHDGRVQATIKADNPETLDILRQDAKGLEQALKDAGLDTSSEDLNFAMRGDGQDSSGEGRGKGDLASLTEGLVDEGEDMSPEIAAGSPMVGADGSLDISV